MTSGLVRVGAGVPVVFARAVRSAGLPLAVALPSRHGVPAPLLRQDAVAAGELLVLAEQARLLAYDPLDRDATVTADEALIRSCRRLLAVWDGSPSSGRDATAHLVAYARGRGLDVDIVWPPGATRLGAPSARTSRPGVRSAVR